jgi:putative ABC transport system permease protein
MIRAFIQLSVLGVVLQPVLVWGQDNVLIVVLYVLFMTLLAALEVTSRCRGDYRVMGAVFVILCGILLLACLFTFGVLIRPKPVLYSPQYVIPICGILLGQCINVLSLSISTMYSFLMIAENNETALSNVDPQVEKGRNSSRPDDDNLSNNSRRLEIEWYLSYGSTTWESIQRLVIISIQTAVTPTLNSISIIGLITIPGVMTGQILAGTSVVQAAVSMHVCCRQPLEA